MSSKIVFEDDLKRYYLSRIAFEREFLLNFCSTAKNNNNFIRVKAMIKIKKGLYTPPFFCF